MKKAFLPIFFFVSFLSLQAQQLYLEGYPALLRTTYEKDIFPDKKNYLALGAKLAVGSDHFQVGGEYRSDLTAAKLPFGNTSSSFKETYYGGFLRYKIARYPAMRFGLVLKAGAGVHDQSVEFASQPNIRYNYDPIVGGQAGAGISIPLTRPFMLELGYTYHFLKRPEFHGIDPHFASYHLFSAGLSLNFVFGKRKQEYDQLRQNRRFRNRN